MSMERKDDMSFRRFGGSSSKISSSSSIGDLANNRQTSPLQSNISGPPRQPSQNTISSATKADAVTMESSPGSPQKALSSSPVFTSSVRSQSSSPSRSGADKNAGNRLVVLGNRFCLARSASTNMAADQQRTDRLTNASSNHESSDRRIAGVSLRSKDALADRAGCPFQRKEISCSPTRPIQVPRRNAAAPPSKMRDVQLSPSSLDGIDSCLPAVGHGHQPKDKQLSPSRLNANEADTLGSGPTISKEAVKKPQPPPIKVRDRIRSLQEDIQARTSRVSRTLPWNSAAMLVSNASKSTTAATSCDEMEAFSSEAECDTNVKVKPKVNLRKSCSSPCLSQKFSTKKRSLGGQDGHGQENGRPAGRGQREKPLKLFNKKNAEKQEQITDKLSKFVISELKVRESNKPPPRTIWEIARLSSYSSRSQSRDTDTEVLTSVTEVAPLAQSCMSLQASDEAVQMRSLSEDRLEAREVRSEPLEDTPFIKGPRRTEYTNSSNEMSTLNSQKINYEKPDDSSIRGSISQSRHEDGNLLSRIDQKASESEIVQCKMIDDHMIQKLENPGEEIPRNLLQSVYSRSGAESSWRSSGFRDNRLKDIEDNIDKRSFDLPMPQQTIHQLSRGAATCTVMNDDIETKVGKSSKQNSRAMRCDLLDDEASLSFKHQVSPDEKISNQQNRQEHGKAPNCPFSQILNSSSSPDIRQSMNTFKTSFQLQTQPKASDQRIGSFQSQSVPKETSHSLNSASKPNLPRHDATVLGSTAQIMDLKIPNNYLDQTSSTLTKLTHNPTVEDQFTKESFDCSLSVGQSLAQMPFQNQSKPASADCASYSKSSTFPHLNNSGQNPWTPHGQTLSAASEQSSSKLTGPHQCRPGGQPPRRPPPPCPVAVGGGLLRSSSNNSQISSEDEEIRKELEGIMTNNNQHVYKAEDEDGFNNWMINRQEGRRQRAQMDGGRFGSKDDINLSSVYTKDRNTREIGRSAASGSHANHAAGSNHPSMSDKGFHSTELTSTSSYDESSASFPEAEASSSDMGYSDHNREKRGEGYQTFIKGSVEKGRTRAEYQKFQVDFNERVAADQSYQILQKENYSGQLDTEGNQTFRKESGERGMIREAYQTFQKESSPGKRKDASFVKEGSPPKRLNNGGESAGDAKMKANDNPSSPKTISSREYGQLGLVGRVRVRLASPEHFSTGSSMDEAEACEAEGKICGRHDQPFPKPKSESNGTSEVGRDRDSGAITDSEDSDSSSEELRIQRRRNMLVRRNSIPEREIDEDDRETAELQVNLRKLSLRDKQRNSLTSSFVNDELNLRTNETDSRAQTRKFDREDSPEFSLESLAISDHESGSEDGEDSETGAIQEEGEEEVDSEGINSDEEDCDLFEVEEISDNEEDVDLEIKNAFASLEDRDKKSLSSMLREGTTANLQRFKEYRQQLRNQNRSSAPQEQPQRMTGLIGQRAGRWGNRLLGGISRSSSESRKGGQRLPPSQQLLRRCRSWQAGFSSGLRYESVSDAGMPLPPSVAASGSAKRNKRIGKEKPTYGLERAPPLGPSWSSAAPSQPHGSGGSSNSSSCSSSMSVATASAAPTTWAASSSLGTGIPPAPPALEPAFPPTGEAGRASRAAPGFVPEVPTVVTQVQEGDQASGGALSPSPPPLEQTRNKVKVEASRKENSSASAQPLSYQCQVTCKTRHSKNRESGPGAMEYQEDNRQQPSGLQQLGDQQLTEQQLAQLMAVIADMDAVKGVVDREGVGGGGARPQGEHHVMSPPPTDQEIQQFINYMGLGDGNQEGMDFETSRGPESESEPVRRASGAKKQASQYFWRRHYLSIIQEEEGEGEATPGQSRPSSRPASAYENSLFRRLVSLSPVLSSAFEQSIRNGGENNSHTGASHVGANGAKHPSVTRPEERESWGSEMSVDSVNSILSEEATSSISAVSSTASSATVCSGHGASASLSWLDSVPPPSNTPDSMASVVRLAGEDAVSDDGRSHPIGDEKIASVRSTPSKGRSRADDLDLSGSTTSTVCGFSGSSRDASLSPAREERPTSKPPPLPTGSFSFRMGSRFKQQIEEIEAEKIKAKTLKTSGSDSESEDDIEQGPRGRQPASDSSREDKSFPRHVGGPRPPDELRGGQSPIRDHDGGDCPTSSTHSSGRAPSQAVVRFLLAESADQELGKVSGNPPSCSVRDSFAKQDNCRIVPASGDLKGGVGRPRPDGRTGTKADTPTRSNHTVVELRIPSGRPLPDLTISRLIAECEEYVEGIRPEQRPAQHNANKPAILNSTISKGDSDQSMVRPEKSDRNCKINVSQPSVSTNCRQPGEVGEGQGGVVRGRPPRIPATQKSVPAKLQLGKDCVSLEQSAKPASRSCQPTIQITDPDKNILICEGSHEVTPSESLTPEPTFSYSETGVVAKFPNSRGSLYDNVTLENASSNNASPRQERKHKDNQDQMRKDKSSSPKDMDKNINGKQQLKYEVDKENQQDEDEGIDNYYSDGSGTPPKVCTLDRNHEPSPAIHSEGYDSAQETNDKRSDKHIHQSLSSSNHPQRASSSETAETVNGDNGLQHDNDRKNPFLDFSNDSEIECLDETAGNPFGDEEEDDIPSNDGRRRQELPPWPTTTLASTSSSNAAAVTNGMEGNNKSNPFETDLSDHADVEINDRKDDTLKRSKNPFVDTDSDMSCDKDEITIGNTSLDLEDEDEEEEERINQELAQVERMDESEDRILATSKFDRQGVSRKTCPSIQDVLDDYDQVMSDIEETLSILSSRQQSRSNTPLSEIGFYLPSRTPTPSQLSLGPHLGLCPSTSSSGLSASPGANVHLRTKNNLRYGDSSTLPSRRPVSERHVTPVVNIFDDLKEYLSSSDISGSELSLDYRLSLAQRTQRRNKKQRLQLQQLAKASYLNRQQKKQQEEATNGCHNDAASSAFINTKIQSISNDDSCLQKSQSYQTLEQRLNSNDRGSMQSKPNKNFDVKSSRDDKSSQPFLARQHDDQRLLWDGRGSKPSTVNNTSDQRLHIVNGTSHLNQHPNKKSPSDFSSSIPLVANKTPDRRSPTGIRSSSSSSEIEAGSSSESQKSQRPGGNDPQLAKHRNLKKSYSASDKENFLAVDATAKSVGDNRHEPPSFAATFSSSSGCGKAKLVSSRLAVNRSVSDVCLNSLSQAGQLPSQLPSSRVAKVSDAPPPRPPLPKFYQPFQDITKPHVAHSKNSEVRCSKIHNESISHSRSAIEINSIWQEAPASSASSHQLSRSYSCDQSNSAGGIPLHNLVTPRCSSAEPWQEKFRSTHTFFNRTPKAAGGNLGGNISQEAQQLSTCATRWQRSRSVEPSLTSQQYPSINGYLSSSRSWWWCWTDRDNRQWGPYHNKMTPSGSSITLNSSMNSNLNFSRPSSRLDEISYIDENVDGSKTSLKFALDQLNSFVGKNLVKKSSSVENLPIEPSKCSTINAEEVKSGVFLAIPAKIDSNGESGEESDDEEEDDLTEDAETVICKSSPFSSPGLMLSRSASLTMTPGQTPSCPTTAPSAPSGGSSPSPPPRPPPPSNYQPAYVSLPRNWRHKNPKFWADGAIKPTS